MTICSVTGAMLASCTQNRPVEGCADFSKSIDESISPKDDFYGYANGTWQKLNPLPDDKSRLGTFDVLYEENQERVRGIIEDATKECAAEGTPNQKIGDLYSLGMDTVRRNAEGVKPLLPLIDKINSISDSKSISEVVAELHRNGISAFFIFGSTPDADNSDMNISILWQSGLGLPDRDYYFDGGERFDMLRTAYVEMVSKFFSILGIEDSASRAQKVFDFEKLLAEQMNTQVENRDPLALNNKRDIKGLLETAPSFDWKNYFAAHQVVAETITVSQLKYFSAMGKILSKSDLQVVKDYLVASTIREYASSLSDELSAISFEFYGHKLVGTPEQRPLWKRVVSVVEDVMGEQVGQVFVQKYFSPSAKQRMVDLIEQLRTAFSQRIDNLSWMGDSTKVQAKEKLNAIIVKVGYPEQWRDYSKLIVDKTKSYAENLMVATQFEYQRDLDKIGKPVDKSEWFMTPQTVNAYYNPQANEIVFPAGILQPPFFYAEGDDAVNYGGIGVVIGHEMTHGFDDQGCQYDKSGNLKNWWTEDDSKCFAEITKELSTYYSGLNAVDTVKCNGELTLGENIADNGGLNIAYQALRNAVGKDASSLVNGQSIDQRFLLSYAHIWASNARAEYTMNQVKTDPHSPAMLRVNGQMPLFDIFYKSFDIPEDSPMYRTPQERIVVW